MGTLFLPSVKEKKHFEIRNVNLEDAREFVEVFTAMVKSCLKTKDNGDAADNFVEYNGIVDFEKLYDTRAENPIELIASALKVADTIGTRGARAVFVDEAGNCAVGTTIIYNRNRATVNFEDNTVLDKLRVNGIPLTIDTPSTNAPSAVDHDDPSWYDSNCSYDDSDAYAMYPSADWRSSGC